MKLQQKIFCFIRSNSIFLLFYWKGLIVFLRLFQLKVGIENLVKFEQFYNKSVFPELKLASGCLFAGLIKSANSLNEFISMSIWNSQIQAEAYSKSHPYQELVKKLEPFLAHSTEWKIELSQNSELQYTPIPIKPALNHYQVTAFSEMGKKAEKNVQELFVRIVSANIKDGSLPELRKIYNEEIIPELKATPGCLYAYLTENMHYNQEVFSLTIWENQTFASMYEKSGHFSKLVDKVKHTFSDYYQWKMQLENVKGKAVSSDDLTVFNYQMVVGESFKV